MATTALALEPGVDAGDPFVLETVGTARSGCAANGGGCDVPVVRVEVEGHSIPNGSSRPIRAWQGRRSIRSLFARTVWPAFWTLNEMADLVRSSDGAAPNRDLRLSIPAETGAPGRCRSRFEVPLARPSTETLQSVAARLEPGLPATNPLDAWGTDNDPYNTFLDCSRHLADDQETGAFAYVVDLHSDRAERGHAWAAERVWKSTDKPFVWSAA